MVQRLTTRVSIFAHRMEGLVDSASQGAERPSEVSSSILCGIGPRLKDFHHLLLSPPKVGGAAFGLSSSGLLGGGGGLPLASAEGGGGTQCGFGGHFALCGTEGSPVAPKVQDKGLVSLKELKRHASFGASQVAKVSPLCGDWNACLLLQLE